MDLLMRAYEECGYDAYNVGINDLALGTDRLKQYASEVNFPFLSANISDSAGNHIFRPYTLVEYQGHQIGVVGVTSPSPANKTLEYKDELNTARQMREELSDRTDYLILLASVWNPVAKTLREELRGYDLIIRSHTNRASRRLQPTAEGDGYYLQTGDEGQYLHVIEMEGAFQTDVTLTDLTIEKQRLRFTESRLARLRDRADGKPLEKAFQGNESTLAFIEKLQGQKATLEEKIDRTQYYIALHLQSLGPEIEGEEKWLSAIEKFNTYLKRIKSN